VRILVAGGTSFVGRAIVRAAVDAGHDVTVINRGVTPSDLPESVVRLIGDREGDLSALSRLSFDTTIDTIAYRPRDVEALAKAVGDRGGHHIQISSVSAYEDPPEEGATELTALLWQEAPTDPNVPINGETYGPLKAACERSAQQYFGNQLTVVRPTYVIGSHDATLRFPYWVERIRKGGKIAVPGPRSNALQYIDARDLGEFVVTLAINQTMGAYHVVNPYPAARFFDVMEKIASHIAPADTELVEVSSDDVAKFDLGTKLPLWSGAESRTASAVNPAAALSVGLKYRALENTVDDVLAWWGERPWPSHWLKPEEELQLLSLRQ
jgi:2'-hydroxyisoflavone reductase